MLEKSRAVNSGIPLAPPRFPRYHRPMVTIHMEPHKSTLTFQRINTVLQLLGKLDLRVNDALIIRGRELLTPDRRIHPGDTITVRLVMSRG